MAIGAIGSNGNVEFKLVDFELLKENESESSVFGEKNNAVADEIDIDDLPEGQQEEYLSMFMSMTGMGESEAKEYLSSKYDNPQKEESESDKNNSWFSNVMGQLADVFNNSKITKTSTVPTREQQIRDYAKRHHISYEAAEEKLYGAKTQYAL